MESEGFLLFCTRSCLAPNGAIWLCSNYTEGNGVIMQSRPRVWKDLDGWVHSESNKFSAVKGFNCNRVSAHTHHLSATTITSSLLAPLSAPPPSKQHKTRNNANICELLYALLLTPCNAVGAPAAERAC